jgi:L-seryl-tRNA(Ser) seleniumtransferase
MLTRPLDAIRGQAHALSPLLAQAVAPRYTVETVELQGQIGSGSLPVDRLASAGLAVAPVGRKGAGRALDALAAALRALPRPVIGRIADDRLLLDLRCLEDEAPLLAQLDDLRRRLGES